MSKEFSTPADVRAAAWRAMILTHVSTLSNKNVIDGLMEAERGNPPDGSRRVEATDTCPTFYYAVWGTEAVVFIAGAARAASLNTIAAQYEGYTFLLGPLAGYNTDIAWYETAAQSVVDAVVSVAGGFTKVMLAGHSAGGCVAWYAYKKYLAMSPAKPCGVVTFGAPKPARRVGPYSPNAQPTLGVCSFFNDNDPVPFVPPVPEGFSVWWASIGNIARNRIREFSPLAVGTQISQVNAIAASVLPNAVPSPLFSELANWLRATEAGMLTPHSIAVYASRLAAAAGLLPIVAVPPEPIPVPPPQLPQNEAGFRAQQAANVQAVLIDERRVNEQPSPVTPANRARVKRFGKLWAVLLGTHQVATFARKRSARSLKNSINRMLHEVTTVPGLDSTTIIHEIETFINDNAVTV